jgi:hypothetical protein
MLCFEVALNGKRVCVAGVRGYGVLTSMLCWAHLDPRKRKKFVPPADWGRTLLHFDVGGISGDSHVRWVERDVRVGDVISVRIVKRSAADPPRRRFPTSESGRGVTKRKRAAVRRRS